MKKKNIFLWSLKFLEGRFGGKMRKLQQIWNFNKKAKIKYLTHMIGATWYINAIYIAFTHFVSFTGYEDEIFEVISNLHIQQSKFGGKFYKFGRILFKMELRRVHGVCFFQFCWCACYIKIARDILGENK